MVWAKDGDDPSVVAFRALIKEWLAAGKLWAASEAQTHSSATGRR